MNALVIAIFLYTPFTFHFSSYFQKQIDQFGKRQYRGITYLFGLKLLKKTVVVGFSIAFFQELTSLWS